MKCTRQLLVDNSTKGSKETKWGKSAACWAFFYPPFRTPDRAGLLYSIQEGPNRMFFLGVIAGLESCFNDSECEYRLIVKGDNKCVIDVLNEKTGRYKLIRFFDVAKSLEKRLRMEKRIDVSYEHISRNEAIYKNVDQGAKRGRDFIESQFGIKLISSNK